MKGNYIYKRCKVSVPVNIALTIYTDGSKNSDSNFVGVACTCPTLSINVKKAISKTASVYTAECLAI